MIEPSSLHRKAPQTDPGHMSAPAPACAKALHRGVRSAGTQELPGPGRRRRPVLRALFFLTTALVLASCITIPRPAPDDSVCYAPSIGGYDYFWYFSSADPFLPLKSPRAEIIRLERFRKWLMKNGYESPRIDVISRRVEARRKILGMIVYDIKYLVKVEQPDGEDSAAQEANGEPAAAPREDTSRREEDAEGRDPVRMNAGTQGPGDSQEKVPQEDPKTPQEQDPATK